MFLTPWKKTQTTTAAAAQMSPLQDIQRMFDRFAGLSMFPNLLGIEGFRNYPVVNVSETSDAVLVRSEVPGLAPDDIELNVEGNTLTIKGEKKDEPEEKGETGYRAERCFGAFMRRIDLPCNVDTKRAEARLDKGVLTLRLPKLAAEVTRTIKIQAS